jgi:hypothetical protein
MEAGRSGIFQRIYIALKANRGIMKPRRHMSAQQKITIIEGPPPIFEDPGAAWPASLGDSLRPYRSALTRMRTFNGPALVERCYHAWKKREPIVLEFRAPDGRITQAPIQAARYVPTADGQLLMLWVRLDPEAVETERDSGE